ncbi:GAF domain-containing protein [Chlorogloeopsis sp. ULAP01]|uniref:GAF domain-containing protein n=1 Tax=Chlorogloeopsis sp. ULAP01 TaxID=3056483 RepID=UPI0025AA357B|nr:GAF domain-containing protein [Chlorogloeopsis sp. ULAP01]MDM9383329.1 GAF domain-containing protein [Chlorogloeopsis sp. ULAP01]
MFWADHVGLQRFYKGWKVLIGQKPTDRKTRLTLSLQKELEWVKEYLSVDTVTFLMPVQNHQQLAVYATIGLEEEIVQQIRIPVGQGFAGHIAATMKPVTVNNLSEIEIVSPILRHKKLKSLVGIPIPIKGNMIGVLHIGSYKSHLFTEYDLQQLQLVGHRISWMIKDSGVLNFEYSHRNQEHCLKTIGCNIRQLFASSYYTLKEQVLTFAAYAQTYLHSKQGKVQFYH